MLRKNKHSFYAGGQRAARVASWCVALLLAGLLLTLGACTPPGDIGVGLPDANANTGAYLIDTLTIRASTVLRDSVVTSTSSNLYVGQYKDPELGTITAKSYFSLNLGSAFQPDQTQVFDSVVLVLKPTSFRYGDTTRTQTLVEVRQLITPISTTKVSFASPKLTPTKYDTLAVLNQTRQTKKLAAPVQRARPNLATLRLPLSDAWGRGLLTAGKNGQLATQDLLTANPAYTGLALVPGATDNASIIGFDASTATAAAVTLYYHDPTDPGTALSHDFPLSGSYRFYHVTDPDRSTTQLKALTTSLKQLDAAQTAQRTFIEGGLGLVTKLEFPYLADVGLFSQHLIVTDATVTAVVPSSTVTPSAVTGALPPPNLSVYLTDQNNHLLSLYPVGTANNTVTYNASTASSTGINRGTYSWSVQNYCQAVINRTIPNNGMLLISNSPTVPTRAVLGGPRNADNKLQLRLYFIGSQ